VKIGIVDKKELNLILRKKNNAKFLIIAVLLDEID
jgi:hypothetical protein